MFREKRRSNCRNRATAAGNERGRAVPNRFGEAR
jgi:hypothetical protein